MPIATIQKMQAARDTGKLKSWLVDTVDAYLASEQYADYVKFEKYHAGKNPVLTAYRNIVNVEGGESLDLTPSNKMSSGFFGIHVSHITGRLRDNPVQILPYLGEAAKTKEAQQERSKATKLLKLKLGKNYDTTIHVTSKYAAIHGITYTFKNHDVLQHFRATEYFMLPDAYTGAFNAGVRFWQIDKSDPEMPWVIQLYEENGLSTWTRDSRTNILTPVYWEGGAWREHIGNGHQQPYRTNLPIGGAGYVATTPPEPGEPYPGFPVVPLYANPEHVSELTPPLEAILIARDMLRTNYMDEANKMRFIQWLIQGYGGDVGKIDAMVDTMVKLGVLVLPGQSDETKVQMTINEPPYLAHREQMRMLGDEYWRFAQILNIDAVVRGDIRVDAISGMLRREDTKMVGVEAEARLHAERLLALENVHDATIVFEHKLLINAGEVAQVISQMTPDMPFKWRLFHNPKIDNALIDDIIEDYDAESIGQTDKDIATYEYLKEKARLEAGGE